MNSGVCILGPRVGRVFEGDVAGGAELQMALLARALGRSGIRCVIVDPKARSSAGTASGPCTVVAVDGWDSGIRGIRFLTHRAPGLLRALLSVRASLYYTRGFSFFSIFAWAAARLRSARFILAVASDADLLPFLDRYRSLYRGRAGLWDWISTIIPDELTRGILQRCADALLVQHEGQARMAAGKGLKARICRNIVDDDLHAAARCEPRGRSVIMVGTLSRYKGLDVLPGLIESLPDVPFEFVGRATDVDGRRMSMMLARLPNVTLHGPLPRAETVRRIACAKVLLNTSPREGFPNTFLEAWAAGTPVVSLHVDPGGILREHGLGVCCNGDLERLAAELRRETYGVDPARARAYIRDHHSGAAAVSVIAQFIS